MIQIKHKNLIFTITLFVLFSHLPLIGQGQRVTHRFGSPISLQVTGQNTSVGFVQRYVLTNAAGNIQYMVNTLPFTGVAVGQYKAYAINYDGSQTVPNLTFGTNITAIGGSCVDTSMALPIGVMDCNNTTGNIMATIAGQNTNSSFTQKYALTDSIGTILQITNTPQYSNLSNGTYNIYALNYETISGVTGLTINQNIYHVTGSCLALSDPLGYVICKPTGEIANNGLDDDGDNLIDCHDPDVSACNCTTTPAISFNVSGQNMAANFTQKYIVTDSFGVIKQIVNTPSVSGLIDGKYRIYALNFDTLTGVTGLTVGTNISGVTGSCFDISLPLLYKICLPQCPIITAVSKTNPTTSTCPDLNNGQISLSTTGSNLRYSKNNGSTWQLLSTFNNLTGGTWTIRVQDSVSLCSIDTAIVLTSPSCVGVEICNNQIDDDGDGKIDGEDDDCTPTACTSPSTIFYDAPTTSPSPNHTTRFVLTDTIGTILKASAFPFFYNYPTGQYRTYTVWYIASTYTPPPQYWQLNIECFGE